MPSPIQISKSIILAVLLILLLSPSSLIAKKKKEPKPKAVPVGTPVLWREPTDIASRDLYLGPGGEAMKPDLSQVTFISDETRGYSKRFRLRDGSGREWIGKMGKEAQPDTVATRLLWAVGYCTDTTYLVPTVEIQGKGVFHDVEFKARSKDVKRLGFWDWSDNPFVGTKELQGLKVLMPLINNWDLKESNTNVLRVKVEGTEEYESRYVVSDLGATFGKTGNMITRNRNDPGAFEKAKFITGVRGNIVQFEFHTTHGGAIVRDVTVEQAKWIGSLLSQLSDQQISDAFRAANYSPEEIQSLTQALRSRINEIVNLPDGTS